MLKCMEPEIYLQMVWGTVYIERASQQIWQNVSNF